MSEPPVGALLPWVWDLLACPVHETPLRQEGAELVCASGDRYPVVDGIPVLLRPDVPPTHPAAARTLMEVASAGAGTRQIPSPVAIDPYVQQALVGTNGYMYQSLQGRLSHYPIPTLRFKPATNGDRLLDIGCNWGRWSLAAARSGFRPIGIDPSLDAIRAARRVARQLDLGAQYLVADARYLPFQSQSFHCVFSYSVWQHFAIDDTATALGSASRVLHDGGRLVVQMANARGLRSLYHQARRGFRPARNFEVRYWQPEDLREAFEATVGPSQLSVDGFFSLNPQSADLALLPRRYQWVVKASETLRRASATRRWLAAIADSVYVTATKASGRPAA